MSKSKFTKYELNEIKKHNLEAQEYEQSILDAIDEYDLKNKSREYLEHEVIRLRFELKKVEEESHLDYEIGLKLLKLGYKTKGIFAKVSKALGSIRKNTSKKKAIEKAKRLWKEALESGDVVKGDKERFIEKLQNEHTDIAKISFEHLSRNVLKYPKKM